MRNVSLETIRRIDGKTIYKNLNLLWSIGTDDFLLGWINYNKMKKLGRNNLLRISFWKIEQKFFIFKKRGNIPWVEYRSENISLYRGILSRDSFIKNLSTRPRIIASKSLLFSRRLLITSNLGRIAVYESERNRGSSKCVRLRKWIIYPPFKLPAEKAEVDLQDIS